MCPTTAVAAVAATTTCFTTADKKNREAAEAKKREAAAKKAEKERLAAEEAAALPDKPKAASKTAQKRTNKTGGIDGALSALNASGIDDALDALNISTTDGKAVSVDRHPERRFKAAYAAYEERRLPEVKEEHKGLRLNQMKDLIRKEFDRSPENPFNQTGVVAHNASKEEIEAARRAEKEKIEKRLEGK